MNIRHTFLGLSTAFVFAAVVGCTKSPRVVLPPPQPVSSPDTVARVHWLGKKSLGLDAGAYYFSRILGLPETLRLQSQTLDKLSIAPWLLSRDPASLTNIPAGFVRPLLEDVVQEESYLEIEQRTNQTAEIVFAIRLSASRSGLWETNLAVAIQSLAGEWPQKSAHGQGWSLRREHGSPKLLELTRVGDWTLLASAQSTNELSASIADRIRRFGVPFFSRATNYWIEAAFDLERSCQALGLENPFRGNVPRLCWFGVEGDGGNLISRGSFTFPQRLNIPMESWNIPTNLIREPLASFTALRGIGPIAAAFKPWSETSALRPPEQLFLWSLDGSTAQAYFAVPVIDAGAQMDRMSEMLLQKVNPWLAKHGTGAFQKLADINGLSWQGLPFWTPFLLAVDANGGCLYGGTAPDSGGMTNPPASSGMINDVTRRTNLVCYDWEVTSSRLVSDFYSGQVLRNAFRKSQLPVESAGSVWLNTLLPRVSSCTTLVTLSAPDQLTWIRKSTLGFTAAELHWLVDWLESPRFPAGLYSTSVPPAPHAE